MFGRLGAGPVARIAAAFADPEPIVFTLGGVVLAPIAAVRTDEGAAPFQGAGSTLRKLTYEVQFTDLPGEPTKKDSFTHRGRRWRIEDRTRRDDVGAWELVVSDAGAA